MATTRRTTKRKLSGVPLKEPLSMACHAVDFSSAPVKVYPRNVQSFFDAVLGILEGLNCAESLSIAIMLKAGDVSQAIKHKSINQFDYNTPESFRRAYQSRRLISKLNFDIGIDRKHAATESFWRSELNCLETNERFRRYWQGDTSVFTPETSDILFRARSIIADILGPLPRLEDLPTRFGPGTTFSRRQQFATLIDKMGELAPSVTPEAAELISQLPLHLLNAFTGGEYMDSQDGTSVDLKVTEVRGSRFGFAPKNSEIFRGTCTEPTINSFIQLGYGGYMKDRLKSRGLNLSIQAAINGHYAQIGSRNSYYATIDLESASDSISHNLILDLLPVDWSEALRKCRSHETLIGGKWHSLQKWSSMGNGYTFELETLIFYSICLAITKDSRVFGDDIIVPCDNSTAVISALAEVGFRTNKDKTFCDGPFRESCGQDFFLGEPVRPLFIKELPDGKPERIFGLANMVREIAARDVNHRGCNSLFRRPWSSIIQWLPRHLRLFGPKYLGDIVIHSDDDTWHARARYQYGITKIKVWSPKPLKKGIEKFHPAVVMTYALYGGDSSGAPHRRKVVYRIVNQVVVLETNDRARWI